MGIEELVTLNEQASKLKNEIIALAKQYSSIEAIFAYIVPLISNEILEDLSAYAHIVKSYDEYADLYKQIAAKYDIGTQTIETNPQIKEIEATYQANLQAINAWYTTRQ